MDITIRNLTEDEALVLFDCAFTFTCSNNVTELEAAFAKLFDAMTPQMQDIYGKYYEQVFQQKAKSIAAVNKCLNGE